MRTKLFIRVAFAAVRKNMTYDPSVMTKRSRQDLFARVSKRLSAIERPSQAPEVCLG